MLRVISDSYTKAGKGVPLDYVTAYVWYSRAMAGGVKAAAEHRKSITRVLTPKQLDQAKTLLTRDEGQPRTLQQQSAPIASSSFVPILRDISGLWLWLLWSVPRRGGFTSLSSLPDASISTQPILALGVLYTRSLREISQAFVTVVASGHSMHQRSPSCVQVPADTPSALAARRILQARLVLPLLFRIRRGRRRRGLGDDQELERRPNGLELHHVFVKGELDRSVQRNDMLLVWLRLSNGVVRVARADDILMAQEIHILLLRFLRAARDRGLRKNGSGLWFGAS